MLGNAWWEGVGASDERTETVEETSHRDIAVIGMAVRLPKADDVRELWDRVAGRFDAVGPFPASRRKDVESLLSGTKLPGGTASYYDGAYLDEIDKFDCRFFRLSPKEAALMSPNQRLWLETAWSAIEDAGYGGRKLAGSRTGVYIGYNGDAFHDYKRLIAERDPASLSLAIPGNLSSIVAGRISYLLDLKGPAMTLDTACSSSLVALHLAVQALRGGECEQALVGGVKTYLLPVDMGIRIGIESSDFRARTFDDSSSGTGGGEGAAAVLLKPLGKALRDRDAVYAVIKGSAINQDGASIGITAPNGRAQEEAIVRAWQDADIDPETIGYIEAHGTGTRLGDPIEIDGMTRAFERYTDRKQFCAVGSVKTNYGHLDTAAGIVGLVKTALALQHRQLPPMLHFREPNRDIPFADSPVYVSDVLRSWDGGESSSPLRAGVSSFGMSGTNAHAVLEEAPLTEGRPLAEDDGRLWTLALSAKTETALIRMAGSYARFLEEPGGQAVSLRDFCYTANTGRGHYEYRAALTAGSPGELREKLRMLEEALRNPQTSLGLGGWGSVRSLDGIWLGRTDGAAIPMLVEVEEALTFSPEKLCRTYAEGGSWDWETLYAEEDCRKIHLPAYPFDRTRCWVEEEASSFAHYRYPEQSADDIAAMASTAVDPSKRTVRLTGRAEDEYSVTELAVAGAWGSALGFTEIGIGDHYYELGGDSILALRIVGQLSERFGREIGIADLMRHPTVAALSAYIDGDATSSEGRTKAERSGEDTGEETPVSAVPDVHPLSRAQLRIFLASQLAGAELRHHMPLAYAVDGPLDAERLRAAFVKLAERHESLRTTFEWSDEGEPRQRIQPFPVVQVEQSRVDSEAEWPSFAASFVRSFDLSRLPLFRVGVATASPDRHLLLLDTHHLISDGASLALLLQEMTALYDGRALTPKNADYRDFVRWQREQADSPAMRKQRAYWLEEALAGPLPQLRLPLDFPRPKTKTSAGGIFRFTIRTELVEGLQRLAKGRQVSLHTVLFSLYSLLMRRYADQEELIVGSLVNGRDQADFRQTVGVFINFLPVRIRVRKDVSFGDVLDEVQRRTLDAYANGQFPFDEMASALNAGANRSRNPLYDTMLVFHNHAAGGERFVSGGLAFSEYALGRDTSALDVKLDLFPGSGGELRGVIEYDAGLFREATIARLSEHFVELAAAMAEDPDSPVGSIRLFEAEEEADLDRRRKLNDGPLPESKRRLDVRIASTFTSEPVAKPLRRWLGQFGIQPRLTFAPYNQIVQHLLNDESASAEDAAATVLLIRPEDWHNSDNAASADDGLDRLDADLDRIFRLIGERSNNGPHFVALMPFAENGPYGRLPEETVRQFRDRLEARAAAAANASLLDFADTAARYRVHRAYDPVADEEGRIPYTEEYFAAIGTEIARALIGANGHPFKVIVVDADNTLWRGVCGEDGPTGVTVSPSYAAFQQLLLRKRGEGMLLALCSKNNEADLWDVFDRNPGMVLRKEHFSAWRVNWNAKPDNVLSLAEELNLGLDSLIFVDDNAAECLGMMAECPEVLTLKLPEEDEMPAFLARVWAWDRLRVTDEDRMRAANYEAERRRQEAARPEVTLEDYLQSLGLKISMRPLAPEEVERAAQLTVRTNQFNLNGVRRTEKDIRGLMQADGAFVRIVEAADRYGEYGRIGLVSATVQGSALVVDAFLLSCRVLGRGVEQAVCAGLKRFALSRGCTELRAAFRRTAKNRPFERFLEESGWMKSEAAGQEAGEIGEIGEAVPFAILLSQVADVPKHVAYYEGISFATEEAYGQTAAGEPERGPYLPVRESGPAESGIKTYDWLLPFDNEERLLHRAYLLPLRYPEASDVVALPDADGHSEEGSRDPKSVYEAPADETEAAVARLWEKLLGGGPYGRNDHFFDAGGDSLQAASLVSFLVRTFGRRVTLADLFDNARLKQMAALLTGDGDAKLLEEGAIPNAPEAELYPVSSAQRRMYFLQQFEPEGTAYNIPTVLMLTGEIDREKLRRAFRQLEERHEALRTSFVLVDGEPYQRIGAPADIELAEWEVEDGTSVIDGTVGEPLKEALRAFVRPFDLHRAPLFRVGLFRLTENRHAMAFDIHHIVADGVSVNVLMEDFLRLYGGYVLSPPRLQYKDYAVWQRSEKETARREEQLQSWLERFAGPIPKLELPADHPRPSVKSTEGSQLVVSLGKEQTDALNRLAQQTGATPFMVLLSAYAAWLMKLSGQSYVVIGTPVAGRVHPDTEKTVGVFVNPLALRIAADPGHTFERLLAVVKEETLRALERQEAPFEDVVERLRVERDLSRNPLFDTMFSMLNMAHADLSAADIAVKPVPFDFGVSQFDIGLSALEEEDGLALTVQYASKVFRAETMKRWVEAFRILLLGIVEQPAARLADIGLLSDEGRRQVVEAFNDTKAAYPEELTLPEMFRRQAERTPERTAAAFEAERLTYRELDERANRIAWTLLDAGLAPEQPVGLMAERSPEMLAGLLGILKAGGAYVPLPPEFPEERLRFMA
ncbi:HAD-IIIC family phosphatase, partial [Cohnella suwonensis]